MKRLAGNLAVLAISTVLSLLLLEGTLRLLGFCPSYLVSDHTVGVRYRPHARYRWTAEGFSRGRMNATGWRDADHQERKPPRTTRILFLGDSFVEALQVPLDSTFHERLERRLNARALADHRFEVIAMGQSGMGTTQEKLVYEKWGSRYDPDIVAVLFVLNDWGDNWRWDGPTQLRPYLLEDGDSLRLDTSFVNTPEFRHLERWTPFKQRSSLLTLMAKIREELRIRRLQNPAEATFIKRTGWYYTWNFDVSPRADSIPAFQLTARILARLAHEVQRDGRRFVLFVAGTAEQEARELVAARAHDPTFDPDKTQRWLASVGARYGFEVVPLTPAFRSMCAVDGRRLWWGTAGVYGHWNSAGHAAAALVMERYFDSQLPGLGGVPARDHRPVSPTQRGVHLRH